MQKFDWSEVQAQDDDFAQPTPGGYICRIVDIQDVPEKQYVKVFFDIVDGEWKGFYSNRRERFGIELPIMYRSYTEKARGMFKGFLKALEESNRNFVADKFDGNEQQLKGMFIGIIMGEEEYMNKNGEVRISLKAVRCCAGPKIRKGEFKVPELKKLPANPTAQKAGQPVQQAAQQSFGTNVPFDDECPF